MIVVTRHTALVELLRRRGVLSSAARVIPHATAEDVRGQEIVGVLPLALAALAASVTEIPLSIPEEWRGRELTLEELESIAGAPVTYRVVRQE